jgi:hypothetical protein
MHPFGVNKNLPILAIGIFALAACSSDSDGETAPSSSSSGGAFLSSSSTAFSSSSVAETLSSSSSSSPIGSCTVSLGYCYNDISLDICTNEGDIFSLESCPVGGDEYCYNYDNWEDCAQIGSTCYFYSVNACLSEGGTIKTKDWCDANAEGGFWEDSCD